MDRKSKLLFWFATLVIVTSVGYTFYQTVILKNYIIEEVEVKEENDMENIEQSVQGEITSDDEPMDEEDVTENQ